MNVRDSLDLVHFRMENIRKAAKDDESVNLSQLAEAIELLEECVRTIARECNVAYVERMQAL